MNNEGNDFAVNPFFPVVLEDNYMYAYKKSKKNAISTFEAVKCNSIFFATSGVESTGSENLTCCQFRNVHNFTLPAFLYDALACGNAPILSENLLEP